MRPSIVDPHGQHLEDSLVKLQGLANYAERYGDAFHRIEASLKDGAKWRVLDLKRADVRTAIANHTGPVLELYKEPAISVTLPTRPTLQGQLQLG